MERFTKTNLALVETPSNERVTEIGGRRFTCALFGNPNSTECGYIQSTGPCSAGLYHIYLPKGLIPHYAAARMGIPNGSTT